MRNLDFSLFIFAVLKVFALLEPFLGEAPGALDWARVPKFCEAVQDGG